MIFFCKVKFFLLLEELLPKIIPCTMCPYSCHFTLCIHTAAMLHYMSYSCYVALCIHTTAMLHYVSTQLPVTLCPYSCHVTLCVHTAAMLHYIPQEYYLKNFSPAMYYHTSHQGPKVNDICFTPNSEIHAYTCC